MSTEVLLGVLVFVTLGSVVVFAYLSAERTNKRLHSNSRKSTLAEDAPNETPPGEKPPDT